jgi:hypothetical protein
LLLPQSHFLFKERRNDGKDIEVRARLNISVRRRGRTEYARSFYAPMKMNRDEILI